MLSILARTIIDFVATISSVQTLQLSQHIRGFLTSLVEIIAKWNLSWSLLAPRQGRRLDCNQIQGHVTCQNWRLFPVMKTDLYYINNEAYNNPAKNKLPPVRVELTNLIINLLMSWCSVNLIWHCLEVWDLYSIDSINHPRPNILWR